MFHRLRLLTLLLAGSLPVPAPAAGLEVVRVFTGWRDAASFQRVSEYFTDKENTGGVVVLRTRPVERAGYYWLVRMKNDGAPMAGTFELQVISPAGPEPKTFTFPVSLPAGRSLFDLGLTGTDWPGAKARPAAWRLRILDAGGKPLAEEKSFLWEMPPKR